MKLEDGGPHGERSTYQRGCRCDSCCEANRLEGAAFMRSWRARKRLEIGRVPALHAGSQVMYGLGCRCDGCCKAHTAYAAEKLAEHPELHGTRTAYCLYDCRCEPCREAGRAWVREYERPSRAGKTARGRKTRRDSM